MFALIAFFKNVLLEILGLHPEIIKDWQTRISKGNNVFPKVKDCCKGFLERMP